MKKNIKQVRKALQLLPKPYTASVSRSSVAQELGVPIDTIIKLDSGENVFGPPFAVSDFNMSELLQDVSLYPDSQSTILKEKIAQRVGVNLNMVAIGNGSDELIDLICRLFLDSSRVLIDATPTFPMYRLFGTVMGATVVDVPRVKDFSLDIPALTKALTKADLLFLANPNNPTGTFTPIADIEQLLAIGKMIVVDEAYFEFCGKSAIGLVQKWPNLIVLRTFSKWAGLAGVRVGYMVAQPEIIDLILAIRPPYSVNMFAQIFAAKIIDDPTKWLQSVDELKEGRDWFLNAASKSDTGLKNWKVVPSQASCVTLLPQRDVKDLAIKTAQELKKAGILVKVMTLNDMQVIRMSVAPVKIMNQVCKALKKIEERNI
mgnify:CR=1 FL=1